MIAHAKVSGKCRMKIFNISLRIKENRLWISIKYVFCTQLIGRRNSFNRLSLSPYAYLTKPHSWFLRKNQVLYKNSSLHTVDFLYMGNHPLSTYTIEHKCKENQFNRLSLSLKHIHTWRNIIVNFVEDGVLYQRLSRYISLVNPHSESPFFHHDFWHTFLYIVLFEILLKFF